MRLVLRAQGRLDEARIEYQLALRLLEGTVDEDHPTLRSVRRNLERLDRSSHPLRRRPSGLTLTG